MSVSVWDTHEAPPSGFESAWSARLATSGHSNYSLVTAHLLWEAAHGRHALAALVEADGRRAALLLRDTREGLVCGWPWRWQVAFERAAGAPLVFAAEDARWVYEQAHALAKRRRLMLYLPSPAGRGIPSFVAGATLIKDLAPAEDALLKSMDTNKRRNVKQAVKAGYTIVDATTPEQFRAFALLQAETEARRGEKLPPIPERAAPGEAWREWEHPWMWLLVAEREGVVEAGSGFGIAPSGMIDYRTNASTLEAMKGGANGALAWEALRRGRERGMRWMNWGGVTTFKKELGGERCAMHLWLGGGGRWMVQNRLTAGAREIRARVAELVKSRRAKAGAHA